MVTIDKSNVQSTYSGKPGCCCGCLGNHRYAKAHRKAGGKRRGLRIKDSEINDRSVAVTVARMNKLIAAGGHSVWIGPKLVSVQTGTRLYIAYFAQETA
jgi:hypothetical protein